MSEQVSRAEFNELKGQLDLVCQHLGLELGDFVVQGSGRRRAEAVEVQDFSGFQQEESFPATQEDSYPVAQEETPVVESEEEVEGWESINDDEDPDHTISYEPQVDEDVQDEEETQEEEAEEPFVEPTVETGEVRHLPTSLNYVEPEEDEDETPLFADDEDDEEESSFEAEGNFDTTDSGVSPEALSRIFDAENILTANDVASKQFSEIKKTLFTSPYDVDSVDEFLDEYLDVLQSKDVSESRYAEALLSLDGRKFPENSEGYKKAEVDAFVEEIAEELKRRIDIVS